MVMEFVSSFFKGFAFGMVVWMAIYLLIASCVSSRPMPTPEEMPAGRKECKVMCWKVGRQFEEYRYNGDCICKPVGAE